MLASSTSFLPLDANKAERIAATHDEPDVRDWVFRRLILEKYPERFQIAIAKKYAHIHKAQGRRQANLFMLDIKDSLSNLQLSLAANNNDIIHYAKRKADEMDRLLMHQHHRPEMAQILCDIVWYRYGIKPPLKSALGKDKVTITFADNDKGNIQVQVSIQGFFGRLTDEKWWRRALRYIHIRNVEAKAIELGIVRQGRDKYVSNENLLRIRQQKQRNRKMLELCIATNELDQSYTLQELSDLSVSNPKNQRNELMTRIAGFDEIALELGHAGLVFTITCPSRMHASRTINDISVSNPKYDGTTPAQAQKYLNGVWSRIRAKLARMGIRAYGFRIAEPHQDGTPHWHVLLYVEHKHSDALAETIKYYALQDSPEDDGAQKHRVDIIKIDRKIGSGTAYIAKYISKGIDGHGLNEDLDGGEPTSAAERVKAWAITWGIRQFQQIGGPLVTIWREFRKLSSHGLQGFIKTVWEATNEGLWANFVKLLGGPQAKRIDMPISIAKQWNDKPNRYQEPTGNQIIGIAYGTLTIPTRIHQWVIRYVAEKLNTPSLDTSPMNTPPPSIDTPSIDTPPLDTPTMQTNLILN